MKPVVSVVVPTYNRASYLARTLKSVKAQRDVPYEVIVVDDGSEEAILPVVRRSGLKEWKYLRQPHAGPAAARNLGMSLARGEFIALLDSDDVWYPGKLAKQLRCFRDPRVLFVHSNVDFIDAAGRRFQRRVITPARRRRVMSYPVGLAFASTALFRKALIERMGGFDTRFRRIFDDSDFYCRLQQLPKGSLRFVPEPLIAQRIMKKNAKPRHTYTFGPEAPGLPGYAKDCLMDHALFMAKRKQLRQPTDRFRPL